MTDKAPIGHPVADLRQVAAEVGCDCGESVCMDRSLAFLLNDAADEIEALRTIACVLLSEAMNPWPEDHPLGAAMRRSLESSGSPADQNDRSNPEVDR